MAGPRDAACRATRGRASTRGRRWWGGGALWGRLSTADVGDGTAGPRGGRAVLEAGNKEKGFATPTETNLLGDALCLTDQDHKSGIERWVPVGGWRLAVGGWRLAVGGCWGLSLSAVLNKKKFFRTAGGWAGRGTMGERIVATSRGRRSEKRTRTATTASRPRQRRRGWPMRWRSGCLDRRPSQTCTRRPVSPLAPPPPPLPVVPSGKKAPCPSGGVTGVVCIQSWHVRRPVYHATCGGVYRPPCGPRRACTSRRRRSGTQSLPKPSQRSETGALPGDGPNGATNGDTSPFCFCPNTNPHREPTHH